MKKQLLTCVILSFFSLAVFAQADTLLQIVAGRANSAAQMKKPYVIIISADAFRWDYADKYQAKNLLRLAAEGVRAESMIPSYPSVTHPNHFAIMSGLYPAHSGIVANDFYDAAEKKMMRPAEALHNGEEPIWITAEKQHMLTASFYWIDAAAPIRKMRPTYYYKTNENKDVLVEDRVRAVKNWLALPEDKRPHFISFYFPEADHAGHKYTPDAPQTKAAVDFIDDAVGRLDAAAKASGLPVNFIFVSDHGMTPIDKAHLLPIPSVFDKDKFVITNEGAFVNIQAKNPADILAAYQQVKATNPTDFEIYLKKDVPEELHYGAKDDKYNRVGDIVLIAHAPRVFSVKPSAGQHGFNPFTTKDMHATFIAWGPAFKQHLSIPPFKNVEVYDLMTHILSIPALPNDGTGALAKEVLR